MDFPCIFSRNPKFICCLKIHLIKSSISSSRFVAPVSLATGGFRGEAHLKGPGAKGPGLEGYGLQRTGEPRALQEWASPLLELKFKYLKLL
jgi:hypothetical protein